MRRGIISESVTANWVKEKTVEQYSGDVAAVVMVVMC